MTEKTVLNRKAEIVTANMDGETVMMCIETGKYYNLGTIGGKIWALLETEKTFSQLVDCLTEEYDVERARCETETETFLRELAEQGLLMITEQR